MKRKGITLMSVVVIILIISIITGTVTITANNAINNINKTKFAMELSMVQDAYDSYDSESLDLPYDNEVKMDLSKLSAADKEKYFPGELAGTETLLKLWKINLDTLKLDDLTMGRGENGPTDIFAISLKTKRIYYVKGKKIGKDIYYYLNTELKNKLGVDQSVVGTEKDGIIIEYDMASLSTPVAVRVKVPNTYDNVTVTTSPTVAVTPYTDTAASEYNTINQNCYIVNKDKSFVGKYIITVGYRKAGIYNTLTKTINTIDSVSPIYDDSEVSQVFSYNRDTKKANVYVSGVKFKNDDDIFKMKYENFDVSAGKTGEDVKKYFMYNGVTVKNGKIPINQGVEKILVYAEDMAGNYGYGVITIQKDIKDSFAATRGELYANPPMPLGFTIKDNMNPFMTWNKGYTILDPDGVEFVWIPVGNNLPKNGTIFGVSSEFGRRASKYTDGLHITSNLNLFEEDSTLSITNSQNVDLEDIYDSVKKYGGFYISKYEATLRPGEVYDCRLGATPVGNLSFDQAKVGAVTVGRKYESSSLEIDVLYASTILPTASHYDTTCQWLITAGFMTEAQAQDNSSGFGNFGSGIMNSGAFTSASEAKLPIKDLVGNAPEWTFETFNNKHVTRSGISSSTQNALMSRRTGNSIAGFRPVLYLTDISKDTTSLPPVPVPK